MQTDRTPPSPLAGALAPFRAVSPALVALFLSMLALAALALLGLLLDPRVITGAPAWSKPLKFALSTAAYALGFAWLLGHLQARARVRRALAGVTVAVLGIELPLIFLQAARGTQSHFNLSSPFNLAVFNVMGIAIAVLWVVQLVTAALLLRQRFDDAALGWALRLGMALTALGAAVGWLMVVPSPAQVEALGRGVGQLSGAHTVGGADGGPGMPLTNWSLLHGDLRAAHFVGLHALQLIPLLALLLQRIPSLGPARRARLVLAFAASYAGLFLLLLWQALRGEPLAAPGATTLAALLLWLALTAAGAAIAARVQKGPAPLAHGALR